MNPLNPVAWIYLVKVRTVGESDKMIPGSNPNQLKLPVVSFKKKIAHPFDPHIKKDYL